MTEGWLLRDVDPSLNLNRRRSVVIREGGGEKRSSERRIGTLFLMKPVSFGRVITLNSFTLL